MLFVIVGIIGEYIAILFSELKDRPVYIVEKPGIWKARGGSILREDQSEAEESFEKSLIKIRKSLLKKLPKRLRKAVLTEDTVSIILKKKTAQAVRGCRSAGL